MMKINFKSLLAMGAFLSIVSLPVQAHPLAIANSTMSPISFTVNNTCSSEIGVVHEVEIKTISEETLNKLCANYASTCEIQGYAGKNCMGKALGGIKYLNEHSIEVFSSGANVAVSATESSLIYTSPIEHR